METTPLTRLTLSLFLFLAPAAPIAAQCELQRFEGLPDLAFAPAIVLDGDLALAAGRLPAGLGMQVLVRDDGGTPDVPQDDEWSLAEVVVPDAFHFTGRLAFDGGLLLAGGTGELEGEGEVRVLQRTSGGWVQLQHMRPPEPGWRDGFGQALAVCAGTLLVGSPGDSLAAPHAGSAGFYERDDLDTRDPGDDTWVETQRVVGLPVELGAFGHALALERELAAVAGAAFPFARSSAVRLYARRPGAAADPLDDRWVEVGVFTSPHLFEDDHFGAHLALSPDFLFVSAPGAAPGNGAVFVLARLEQGVLGDPSDDAWVPQPALTGAGTAPGDAHGGALAVAGDRLLVGWPLADAGTGSARLYRRIDAGKRGDPSDDHWVLQGELRPDDVLPGSYFGESVALQGNTALVTSSGRLHVHTAKCLKLRSRGLTY